VQPSSPFKPLTVGLLATAAAMLLTGCAKHGAKPPTENTMTQAGVYSGRNSGPDASNTGGADGAGGAPVGTSAPNSNVTSNTTGNRTGPI